MNAGIVLKQMVVIFLLILVGYILQKKKLVTQKDGACLSKLIVEVFNPAIIVSSVIGSSNNGEENITGTVFLAAVLFLVLILLAVPYQRYLQEAVKKRRYIL
ncbi:hypothetical protein DXB96_10305 [Clostridium sp. OM07-10AC]|nr:hypothetical protein DXC08_11780 [Clostridium sp. OM07-9AC]RHV03031.1 hypothetical protein DXB96_10305 [Clostridium sp. OM07-10AC]